MANENLHKAKEAKNDEFYTQLNDVAEELRHYKEHFKGKVVFCNCDDPTSSAFWRYFHLNFDHLGLKKNLYQRIMIRKGQLIRWSIPAEMTIILKPESKRLWKEMEIFGIKNALTCWKKLILW